MFCQVKLAISCAAQMVHTSRGAPAFWRASYSLQVLMLSSQHPCVFVLIEYCWLLFSKCQNDLSGECNVTTRLFFPFFCGCFTTLTPVSNEWTVSSPGHAPPKRAGEFKSFLSWSSSSNTVPFMQRNDPSRIEWKRMGPFLTTAPPGAPKDRAGGMLDTLSIFHWSMKNRNADLGHLFPSSVGCFDPVQRN